MSGLHHPDAAEVLPSGWTQDDRGVIAEVLDAFAAAGLAVVRVGDVPPWMEQLRPMFDVDAPPDHVGWFVGESGDVEWLTDSDFHGAYADRVYVVKREASS